MTTIAETADPKLPAEEERGKYESPTDTHMTRNANHQNGRLESEQNHEEEDEHLISYSSQTSIVPSASGCSVASDYTPTAVSISEEVEGESSGDGHRSDEIKSLDEDDGDGTTHCENDKGELQRQAQPLSQPQSEHGDDMNGNGKIDENGAEKEEETALLCKILDTNRCEDADLRYFNCSFFHQYEYDHEDIDMEMNMNNGAMPDPIDRNIMGPKSCEYCHAASTMECDPNTCERPPLYFLKKRPPFETYRDR